MGLLRTTIGLLGVVGALAACALPQQCPFPPAATVQALLPCLQNTNGPMPQNCCDTARPLASNPCIRVWLGMPQLASFRGQIDQARIACQAPEFPPCNADVAAQCPTECGTQGQQGEQGQQGQQGQQQQGYQQGQQQQQGQQGQQGYEQGQQGQQQQGQQGQQQQGQQGQQQQAAKPCDLPPLCPFPSGEILGTLIKCLDSNGTVSKKCCNTARPLATNPCVRVWLSMPELTGFKDNIDKARQDCNFPEYPQCADDVKNLCQAECAADIPIPKGFCEIPEQCKLPKPSEWMKLLPCTEDISNATNKQLCCDAARPMASNPCVHLWLQLPQVQNFLPKLDETKNACQLPQLPECDDSIKAACPQECALPLGTKSVVNVEIQGNVGNVQYQGNVQGKGMIPPQPACKDNEEFTSCTSSSCFEAKCINKKVVVPGPVCTADCRQGCRCKGGFARNNIGVCISEQDCTGNQCPDFQCALHCDYGFLKDDKGCDTCQCLPQPKCPDLMCALQCTLQKDDKGCNICQCEGQKCPDLMCDLQCDNGFKKDDKGCDTCVCNLQPIQPIPPIHPACPDVRCMLYCQNGFQKDNNGCDLCRCNEVGATVTTTTVSTRPFGRKGKKFGKKAKSTTSSSSSSNYAGQSGSSGSSGSMGSGYSGSTR